MVEPIAEFYIIVTSVKEHTWQGRVTCGDLVRSFVSELQMLRCMMEFAPGLTPDSQWSSGDFLEQEDVT